ncbi:MAG: phosphatidylglycerophosphatase A [Micavibrio sp.]|nr:phosphatidylglycerophosphatase A [Micavibrio sp.]|tara:strand:+ start:961 stop:1464 length:504 start_codon:yes stop_codon:yes gene_type:complete
MLGLQHKEKLKFIDFKSPVTWIATWGGSGFISPASGTWGTLAGLPFGIGLMMVGGPIALLIGLAIVIPLGLWASKHFEIMARDKDSGMIVIDEVAGLWIALLPAVLTSWSVAAAFLLFRFFDVLKPYPISWIDKKMQGAFSIMGDDLMAGIYAAIVLIGLQYVGFAS